jgi:hypothetical protein
MSCPKVQEVLPEEGWRISLSMARREALLWSVEQHAQKDGGGHLVKLVSKRNKELHQCALPCVEFAEEAAPYSGEQSCVFESLPCNLNNHLQVLFENELSAMASASRVVLSDENDHASKSTLAFLGGWRGAPEDANGGGCPWRQ